MRRPCLPTDLLVSYHAPVSTTPKRRQSYDDHGFAFGYLDWTASS